MHPYFKKLNIMMPDKIDESQLKGEYAVDYANKIVYYNIRNKDYFLKIFPKFSFIPPDSIFFVEVNHSIGPHIDHGPIACVNFYFNPNNGITTFYEKINQNDKGTTYPGRETSNLFNGVPLKEIIEFKANKQETYLLNISKIHSVSSFNLSDKRKFITWQWHNESYENILETLKEENVSI